MYNILLFLHSWNRWIVLALALVVIFKAFSGWFGKKDFLKADNALGGAFIGTLHLQWLLGLILYFVSPFGSQAFAMGMGVVMKNPVYRYWSVEHITVMIIAIAVAQTGRILSKKSATALEKHKKAAIFYTIALVLILSRIPFDQVERLFRAL
jgi:hypothetical protein